eukprot:m.384035 g.384035  ORF g.384035 m.384035 type:complete len:357 (+) comp20048_c0_seq8:3246-4316(+)
MAANAPYASTVLITGASGFIASHIIDRLRHSGRFRVRGSVRCRTRASLVAHLPTTGPNPVELVEANLLLDEGWAHAVQGCSHVIHTASPFPSKAPTDGGKALIETAVQGTLRVLRACAAEPSVTRVVLTSSIAAVAPGMPTSSKGQPHVFDDEDWSELTLADAYVKSKTLAEKAAWEFVERLPAGQRLELCVINPGVTLGPLLSPARGTSAELLLSLLNGRLPMLPQISWSIVDVRDVADSHVRALTSPAAAGRRYLCVAGTCTFADMARVINEHFRHRGVSVATRVAPKPMLWLASFFDSGLAWVFPRVGLLEMFDAHKIQLELGVVFRTQQDTLVDMCNSLYWLGLARLPPAKL